MQPPVSHAAQQSLGFVFSSCINTLEDRVCSMDNSEASKHTYQRDKKQIGIDREISTGLFWRF